MRLEFPNGLVRDVAEKRVDKMSPSSTGPPAERPKPPRRVGLGDYTEQLLTSIGVTKERYAAIKEKFGFAPTCHCEARKQWLNQVDQWVRNHLGM